VEKGAQGQSLSLSWLLAIILLLWLNGSAAECFCDTFLLLLSNSRGIEEGERTKVQKKQNVIFRPNSWMS
jgi:hypothetical protein